jgi:hypothetical protein
VRLAFQYRGPNPVMGDKWTSEKCASVNGVFMLSAAGCGRAGLG